jgi:hypothetical protein
VLPEGMIVVLCSPVGPFRSAFFFAVCGRYAQRENHGDRRTKLADSLVTPM